MMKYDMAEHKPIEKEIVRGENQLTSNVKIEDIETGEWSVSIMLKDITENTILSTYKMIEIKEGENNLEVIFGIPQIPYEPSDGTSVTTDSAVILELNSVGANFPTTSSIYSELNSIKYYVYFGEDYNLNEKNILNTNQEIKSTESGIMLEYSSLPTLEAGKTYYWKIKAENSQGSSESYIRTLKIKNMVPLPVPITPSGIVVGTLSEFTWSVANDIEGDNQYQIFVSRDPVAGGTMESMTFPSTGYITSKNYTLTSTEQNWFTIGYDYNWYVMITDSNGTTVGGNATFQMY